MYQKLNLKDNQIEELKKFHKSYFDIETILSSASELKYIHELKSILTEEFVNPSPNFVKYLGKKVYNGTFTPKVLEQFTDFVKSILRNNIDAERITYRDAVSYFAIFVDDNNRKPICRLYFNSETNKKIAIIDDNKKEIKHKINSLDDIYLYSQDLIDSIKKYE